MALSNLLIGDGAARQPVRHAPVRRRAPAEAIAETTRAQDDLFRFKVDFVRRRALPLLKGGAHVHATAEDDAIVERSSPRTDRATANSPSPARLRGCWTREKAQTHPEAARSPTNPESDAASSAGARHGSTTAHIRGWVIFRFPETVDYWHLVDVRASRRRSCPRRWSGPDWRLRRRDGFGLTDARMTPREVLSEIHYCVLCHERDKDSCSKGLHDKDGSDRRQPARHRARRLSARREDLRDARAAEGRRCRSARSRSSSLDNPMCPGTGHRICNDCMKSCIYQKQEPVNIPQIETGVLTDVLEPAVGRRDLRAADALESAERAAAVRAALQREERPGRRPRPRRLHAGALSGERGLRRRRRRRR